MNVYNKIDFPILFFFNLCFLIFTIKLVCLLHLEKNIFLVKRPSSIAKKCLRKGRKKIGLAAVLLFYCIKLDWTEKNWSKENLVDLWREGLKTSKTINLMNEIKICIHSFMILCSAALHCKGLTLFPTWKYQVACSTMGQFHQHFTRTFFVGYSVLCSFSLLNYILKFFGERILAQKLFVKCWLNWPRVCAVSHCTRSNSLSALFIFAYSTWIFFSYHLFSLREVVV